MSEEPVGTEGYPLAVLKDFWEHLKWEVRIAHYENTGPAGRIHPELAEALRPYLRRYRFQPLLFCHAVQAENETIARLALGQFREQRAALMARSLAALEALDPLLAEVFACLEATAGEAIGATPTRIIPAAAFLMEQERQEGESDELGGTEGTD